MYLRLFFKLIETKWFSTFEILLFSNFSLCLSKSSHLWRFCHVLSILKKICNVILDGKFKKRSIRSKIGLLQLYYYAVWLKGIFLPTFIYFFCAVFLWAISKLLKVQLIKCILYVHVGIVRIEIIVMLLLKSKIEMRYEISVFILII